MASLLPPELISSVLDQLIKSSPGHQPIYHPSHPVTKTLQALSLTSKAIYPIAIKYLYRHCLYLNDCISYACFRRTLGLDLGFNHPQSLAHGQSARSATWDEEEIPKCITSIFISPMGLPSTPMGTPTCETERTPYTPLVRLKHIVSLFRTIGPTLKRLVLDMQPIYSPHSEAQDSVSRGSTHVFVSMPKLEELVASYDALDHFHVAPPNLKRLAITVDNMHKAAMRFIFAASALEMLIVLRPKEFSAADIDKLFAAYKGQSLDIVFVDVNANHGTPPDTRDWTDEDSVRIWEADVPTSFYGDEDELILCDDSIWRGAVEGTLWSLEGKRRMASWNEVQRRLAGPVHQVVG